MLSCDQQPASDVLFNNVVRLYRLANKPQLSTGKPPTGAWILWLARVRIKMWHFIGIIHVWCQRNFMTGRNATEVGEWQAFGVFKILLEQVDISSMAPLIAKFMGPTWDPSGADRTQVGPTLAPWTLLSGTLTGPIKQHFSLWRNKFNTPYQSNTNKGNRYLKHCCVTLDECWNMIPQVISIDAVCRTHFPMRWGNLNNQHLRLASVNGKRIVWILSNILLSRCFHSTLSTFGGIRNRRSSV